MAMDKIDRLMIYNMLLNGVVNVEFTKANGEYRSMQCTLNEGAIESGGDKPTPMKSVDLGLDLKDSQRVWSIDDRGWRTFKYSKVFGAQLYWGHE